MMEVVAGVLVDADGRTLLAKRPVGQHLAGFWELPGGTLEAGETHVEALHRELAEELAVDADTIDPQPLIRVPRRHGDVSLVLQAHRVRHWQGAPHNREHAALAWQAPEAIHLPALASADRFIVKALRLPARYPVTPDVPAGDDMRDLLIGALMRGETLLELRLPAWPVDAVRALAAEVLPVCREKQATLMLNGDIDGARQLGQGVGVHVRSAQLRKLEARPLPPEQWVGASCHDPDELRRAEHVADFAVLSPVAATATHPEAVPMGWSTFATAVARTALPVYALGGMQPEDLARARQAGAQGIAGIRAFWP